MKGGGDTVPPLQTAVDTEQIRNVQDSERYAIHVFGTKRFLLHASALLSSLWCPRTDCEAKPELHQRATQRDGLLPHGQRCAKQSQGLFNILKGLSHEN